MCLLECFKRGIDSSLITALLSKNGFSDLMTFTIGFEDVRFNEAEHAKDIATMTKHTEHYFSLEDLKKKLMFILAFLMNHLVMSHRYQ